MNLVPQIVRICSPSEQKVPKLQPAKEIFSREWLPSIPVTHTSLEWCWIPANKQELSMDKTTLLDLHCPVINFNIESLVWSPASTTKVAALQYTKTSLKSIKLCIKLYHIENGSLSKKKRLEMKRAVTTSPINPLCKLISASTRNIYATFCKTRQEGMVALEWLTWGTILLGHILFATQAEDISMILSIIRVQIGRGWREEHSCEINFIIITG